MSLIFATADSTVYTPFSYTTTKPGSVTTFKPACAVRLVSFSIKACGCDAL